MKEPELTPWYPADIKPIRVGWYQRQHSVFIRSTTQDYIPDYFDGVSWWLGYGTGKKSNDLSYIDLPWRGLAKKPKGSN